MQGMVVEGATGTMAFMSQETILGSKQNLKTELESYFLILLYLQLHLHAPWATDNLPGFLSKRLQCFGTTEVFQNMLMTVATDAQAKLENLSVA